MRKRQRPSILLAALLLVLYLWSPYLNILPLPVFAQPPPSQDTGHTSLPPGTVVDRSATPKLVQSQDFDYRVSTRMVSTSSGCTGTQGCLVWITAQGSITFSKQNPFAMSYARSGKGDNSEVTFAAFGVKQDGQDLLVPGASAVTTTASTYDVNTTELSGASGTVQGHLGVTYDFGQVPFKATATYASAAPGSNFNVFWMVAGHDYVTDPVANSTGQISGVPAGGNVTIGARPAVYLTSTPSRHGPHTLVGVWDAGGATFVYGKMRFPGQDGGRKYDSVEAVFATNQAKVDPVLVQENESTCSFPCYGQTGNTFFSPVTAGDMLLVTVVSDDLTKLTVSDSLGTNLVQVVNATSSKCDSNTGTCQADIFSGVLSSSGRDTVSVSEGSSDVALRMQMWEFGGVVGLGSTVSCSPVCSSVAYPGDAVLIATGRDVKGAGAGFSWYPYPISVVAGSEYGIPAGGGSTSFPFSPLANDVEVGAVLKPAPVAPTAVPPWGEPGLSPYESYVNNAVVYVSLGNGLVSVEQPTFNLPGRDLTVAPTLFYEEPGVFRGASSSSPFQYDNFTAARLGYGWSLNLPWLGPNYVHLANGQQYPYSWNGGTKMQVHGPVDFELTSTGANGVCPCRLLLPSGAVYAFDSGSRLVSETDSTGQNSIQFVYGENGLSSITDSVGRVVSFGYNPQGMLASITAPGGRTWSLTYAGNDLFSVQNSVGDLESFAYDTANPWLLTEVVYAAGGLVTLGYGSASVPGGTSYVVNLRNTQTSFVSITQSDRIDYTFDKGVLTWANMTEADGTGAIQGHVRDHYSLAAGAAKSYSQNAVGITTRAVENDFSSNRLNSTKVENSFGAVLATTSYQYDDWGNVVYAKDTNGHETWLSYYGASSYGGFDASGCSPSGFYVDPAIPSAHSLLAGTCTYQDVGKFVQQETFNAYNGNAELTQQKVSHGGGFLYTDYSYDAYGNVVSTKDPDGNYVYDHHSPTYAAAYLTAKSTVANGQNITTTYAYDFNTGFMTSTTDPDGHVTRTAHDALGRTLSVTYPAVDGVSSVESYSYNDPAGLVTVTDPRGQQTKEYFDGLGRMTEVQAMNGSSVYSSTFYTYNWLDKEASVQVPSGFTYYFSYDQAGRPVKETFPDGSSATATYNDDLSAVTTKDQDGHQTFYRYDLGGRLIAVQQYSTPTQSFVTNYVYDGVGNLLQVANNIAQFTTYQYDDLNRLLKVTNPDGNSTAYSYDALGNLVGKTTPNGAAISYVYDQANRLVSAQYPDGSQTGFAYDADGNTIRVTGTLSGSTTEAYSYDAMNRVVSSSLTAGGDHTYTTSYSYDVSGNPVRITYPDGLAVSMTYDALDRLKGVGNYASLAYNLDGGITSVTFGDGEVQTYTYDSRDRPLSVIDASGNKKLLSLAYAYDKASNIFGISGASFTYDNMSRVISTKAGGGTQSFTYDGAGNILSSAGNGKNSATVYKNCGFYPNALSGTVVQCGLDRNGNVVSKTGGWAYSYNFEDELVAAALNGVTQQTNVYDGLGNRVEKTEGGTSTVFTYQGVNLLFEKDLATGTTTDHIYGDGMQLAKVAAGTTYYYHEDQVGSNRLVTYADPHNGKASTQFSSGYEPYGANYQAKGSETFQYTDRMLDSATGLYYFNARFYDPSMMRFDTKDSAPGSQRNPATINPYAYAGGNPMNNIDPTGLDWNPLTWTWSQALLFGAVAVLTVASVVQLGLDIGTDVLDAAAISELVSQIGLTGAAVAGLPAIALTSEDSSGIDPQIIAAAIDSALGARFGDLETGRKLSIAQLASLEGLLGERYMNAQTGDINNVEGPFTFIGASGIERTPDSIVNLEDNGPPVIGDVKVGYYHDKVQASDYAKVAKSGLLRPGIFFFLESPLTGKIGAPQGILEVLRGAGFDIVYIKGPWWRMIPGP